MKTVNPYKMLNLHKPNLPKSTIRPLKHPSSSSNPYHLHNYHSAHELPSFLENHHEPSEPSLSYNSSLKSPTIYSLGFSHLKLILKP